MKYLALMLLIFCSPCFAKEMNSATSYYNFATKVIYSLGGSIAKCDSYALDDPTTEWICGSYNQSHENFMNDLELIIKPKDNAKANSDWLTFYDDNTIDFYGRTYLLNNTKMLIAFDPSETGREVFIGVSPKIFSLTEYGVAYNSKTPNKPINNSSNSRLPLKGNYDCKNFSNQAEAIRFFKSNGFNADYDPYNLDADNNGIPCEVPKETSSNASKCPKNKYWVDPYVRKNGTRVRGHCRKKR